MALRWRVYAFLVALTLILASCGTGSEQPPAATGDDGDGSGASPTSAPGTETPGDPREQAMAELYELAREEGSVVVSSSDLAIPDLAEAFTERFPGIEVEHISNTGGATTEALVTEVAAGRDPSIDVGFTTHSTIPPLMDEDLIDTEIDWAALGVPQDWILYDGLWVLWYDQVQVISYNTDQLTGDDIPDGFDDLIDDDQLANAIAVDPRGHGIGPYAFLVGEDDAREYGERLVELEPVYAQTNGAQMSIAVGSGQALVGFMDHLDKALKIQADGAPIDWVKTVDQAPAQEFGWFVPRNAAHPNAAKLWVAWTTTPEAQQIFEDLGFGGTVTPDSTSLLRQLLDENGIEVVRLPLEDWEANIAFRQEMSSLFGAQ